MNTDTPILDILEPELMTRLGESRRPQLPDGGSQTGREGNQIAVLAKEPGGRLQDAFTVNRRRCRARASPP